MRSQLANLRTLVLPFGTVTGTRIIIDGITGRIEFYDAANNFVGLLSTDRWYTGLDGAEQVQLDPFGGLRVRDSDGALAALMNAVGGLQIMEPVSGEVAASLTKHGFHVSSDGHTIDVGGGPTLNSPTPKYNGQTAVIPTTNHVTPAISSFTANDMEIRHVTAWSNSPLASNSFTPPVGYTEQTDLFNNASDCALATTIATRQPGVSAAARTFVSTQGSFQFNVGHTVVVKAASGIAPTVRGVSNAPFKISTATTITDSLTPPAGTLAGDILLAFVAMGNDGGSVPTGWTVPDGWIFLGAKFFTSAGSTVACGVWAKVATADDALIPTYSVTINCDVGTKKFQASIIGIADADSGGAIDLGIGFGSDAFLYRVSEGILNVENDLQVEGFTLPRGNLLAASSTGGSAALNPAGTRFAPPGAGVTVQNTSPVTRRYLAVAQSRFSAAAAVHSLYRATVLDGALVDLGTVLAHQQVHTNVAGGAGQVGGFAISTFTVPAGGAQNVQAGGLRIPATGNAADTIVQGQIYVLDIGG